MLTKIASTHLHLRNNSHCRDLISRTKKGCIDVKKRIFKGCEPEEHNQVQARAGSLILILA